MYIELGSTKINYSANTGNDFIILAQIVDSPMSYEKPVIVRNASELDIWFGKNFSDRDYLLELVSMGISLFLYKPVSPEPNSAGIDDFIDLSNYARYETTINYYESLIINDDYKRENVLYPVKINNTGTEDYIWKFNDGSNTEGKFIPVKDLPQNLIPYNTKSLNNRDTLVIYENLSNKEFIYISPSYINNMSGSEMGQFMLIEDNVDNLSISNLDLKRLKSNLQTCMYRLTFDSIDLFKTINTELNYVEFNKKIYGFCSTDTFNDKLTIAWELLKKGLPDYSFEIITNVDRLNGREKILKCFNINDDVLISDLANVKHFYNISGFCMEPDFNYTNNIVYKKINNTPNYKKKISFISKTIGTGEVGGEIEVKITKPVDNYYRVELSRFGYSELFEGSTQGTKDYLGLEDIINKNSKLVYCEINDRSNLPLGSWTLTGGTNENLSGANYLKALECLCDPPEPIYFDYFLVPDVNRFPIDTNYAKKYYKIYDNLLQLSKTIGCQVLIQNSPGIITTECDFEVDRLNIDKIGGVEVIINRTDFEVIDLDYENKDFELVTEKNIDIFYSSELNLVGTNKFTDDTTIEYYVTQGDYSYNYIDDLDNRLIYFYNSMEIYGSKRPGYYLYLMNLFEDTYSATSDKIYYQTPVSEYYTNLFNKDINNEVTRSELEIIKELEKGKCNYLLSNNHIYYYEKFQNGNSYLTTGWMRFCIEKIKRELIKNKWLILDSKYYGKIEENIKSILSKIKNKFSIIREIELADLNISYSDKKIDIKIDSYVSDLVNNSIRIDVTLNYNT